MTRSISHYLFHIAVEAPARQTVTVKLEDLALPASVIESLAQVNSTPVRAPLSTGLVTELNALRVKQRLIYDECCIYAAGQHFLVSDYFTQAQQMLSDLRKDIDEANVRLAAAWNDEYDRWCVFINELLRPVIGNSHLFDMACQAYRGMFPTKKTFDNLIRINVLGPLLVDLTPVAKPVDGDLSSTMAYENSQNTASLLAMAKGVAEDKAASVCAALLDELDVRDENPRVTIGRIQTGTQAKRGSWQVAAEQLKLVAANVPGYEKAADLAERLLKAGLGLQSSDKAEAQRSFTEFNEVNMLIRAEFEEIHHRLTKGGKAGADVLAQSLSMTSEYKRIALAIQNAPDTDSLAEARAEFQSEKAVMTQRIKKLETLMKRREEYIHAAAQGIDEIKKEVQNLPVVADF